MPKIEDKDREEIARLISEGYTSGILDDEGDDEYAVLPKRIAWSLDMNVFAR